jgi:MraZ protein
MQGSSAYQFVIHRGFEKCLMMYEKHVWDEVVKEVQQLNVYSKKEREFLRFFFRGATLVVLDGSDRILLTKRQMQHAGIGKEVVLAPLNDRIELWSPDAYEALVETEPDDLSALAEEVLGRLNGEKATDQ